MFSDLPEAVRQALRERFSNPLIGGFVVSWCLWNWKFLVILFSDNKVSVTFSLVRDIVFPGYWDVILQGIAFPLVTTLIYIFVFPYPSQYVYEYLLRAQRRARAARQAIEEEALLSREESVQIFRHMREEKKRHEELVAQLNAEVEMLSKRLNTVSKEESNVEKNEVSNSGNGITDAQFEIMKSIAASPRGRLAEDSIVASDEPEKRLLLRYELEGLIGANLLKRSNVPGTKNFFVEFTYPGSRKYFEEKSRRE